MLKLYGNYFNGFEVSDYAKECGYVDYQTLVKGYNVIANNDVLSIVDDWEQLSGFSREDIFCYYIIDNLCANMMQKIDEQVFHSDRLNMYVWGVDHWGTAWSNVLTSIKIEKDGEEE